MPQPKFLMLHLVANYPTPKIFKQSLLQILAFEPQYLEIQYPFTNPLADGKTIYDANQIAVKYTQSLSQMLQMVKKIYVQTNSSTKLILMTYFTPLSVLKCEEVVDMLVTNNFEGMIVPDLSFGTPEQKQYSQMFQNHNLELIPVIAPNTPPERLQFIKSFCRPNQVIYATARSGQTGQQTAMTSQITEYIQGLQATFEQQKIALGFGISTHTQVTQIQNMSVIPVIGSAIVKAIENGDLENKLKEIGG